MQKKSNLDKVPIFIDKQESSLQKDLSNEPHPQTLGIKHVSFELDT